MSVKGEKYKSMAAMKKHEKSEPMAMKMKEYGTKKMAKKPAAKKMVMKKMGKMK
jgi:hypothetical protein